LLLVGAAEVQPATQLLVLVVEAAEAAHLLPVLAADRELLAKETQADQGLVVRHTGAAAAVVQDQPVIMPPAVREEMGAQAVRLTLWPMLVAAVAAPVLLIQPEVEAVAVAERLLITEETALRVLPIQGAAAVQEQRSLRAQGSWGIGSSYPIC